MAQEISIQSSIKVKKASLGVSKSSNFTADMAGTAYVAGVQSVPTTAAGTMLGLGAVVNAGVAWFANVDAANYIELGIQVSGTFYAFVKLLPGESLPLRLGTNAVYARAHTAAAALDVTIVEA